MSALVLSSFLLLAAPAQAPPVTRTVTVIGLSDYHSHAVPFRSEGRAAQAGIARAVALLRQAKAMDPHTLVLSGGDTMNAGVPAWSDEFKCIEWPWLDGLVDAMALGNHDLDYGPEVFEQCRAGVKYPVLAANLLTADGTPHLQVEGKPYLVRSIGGVKIGVFALAGPDFVRLVKGTNLPPGTRVEDPLKTARAVVEALRQKEGVSAVILIGHQDRADDEAVARAVPGIDLILGSHSHLKADLRRIPRTRTWYVSPYQYLTYVSRLTLTFTGVRLTSVTGGLVPLDERQPEDPEVAARVARMQQQLIARRPERFEVIGRTALELSDAGVDSGESLIGNWATDVLRQAAGTHVFLSTASSFRAALPLGEVTAEDFASAFPYPNAITVAEMTGAQLATLLAHAVKKRGSDGYSQQSGLRFRLMNGRPVSISVVKDPRHVEAGWAPLQRAAVYRVATTDFQAYVAGGYKELFAAARSLRRTDQDVHTLLRAALRAGATADLDGRAGARTPSVP